MPELGSICRWRSLHSRWLYAADLIKSGGLPTTVFHCNKLIEAYSKDGHLKEARHLFDAMPERNVFTWNAMIHGHIKNKDLAEARSLFNAAPEKDSVTYNSMISGYAGESHEPEAVELFAEMRRRGTRTDEFTLTTMLNVTAKLSDHLCYGRQIHECMVKTGNDADGFGVSSLIDMYSKCGCFPDALRTFNGTGEVDSVSKNAMVAACCREGDLEMAFDLFWGVPAANDTVSWNTLISGFAQNGHGEMALELFVQMTGDGIRWNEHTLASILGACTSLKSLKHGKQVHAWVLKKDMGSNPFISSGIVDFYCKCDELIYAEVVHAETCADNVFSTTSMVVGHSRRGNMEEARRLFDSLGEKNSVVLTALFSGYIKSQQCEAVFELFRDSRRNVEEVMVSDTLLLVSVLGACSIRADLDHGKQIHNHILRTGIEMEEKLGSALLDMYAKCGEIKYAEEVFGRVPMKDRVLYNAMIAGFAHNGQEKEATQLFAEMLERGIGPDTVTFVALLSACRHAGLVEAGEKYFHSMSEEYGIPPEIDHYSCMVDLFGRANRLDKALSLMKSIVPSKADAIIWGTFLNACRANGNTELAKEAEEKVLRMEAGNGARYVQLANAFAAEGDWREVERIRRKMRGKEVKKHAGCSWVHVGKKVHTFTSADWFHSEAGAIYAMLVSLNAEMVEGDT